MRRKDLTQSSGKIAIARLLNKTIKALIIIAGATFIFYMADLNLTAVLTGLGVGGIAVAFAAQKTLENLFGGVMIISDQPIRVGIIVAQVIFRALLRTLVFGRQSFVPLTGQLFQSPMVSLPR